jgi:hypothetical protein
VQAEHVVQEKFTIAREATPAEARAPRGLRVVGLCLVVAIAVVVFGIVERRQNEVTVAHGLSASDSRSRGTHAQSARRSPPGSAGQHQAWYEAPMYARQRLFERCGIFDYGAP